MALIRNLDGVQHEHIRKVIDATFNALHDELTTAYYQFWRLGLSQPFKGYDVLATPADSKVQFDKLHALIFHKRDIAFDDENLLQPIELQVPLDEYPLRATVLAAIEDLRLQGIEFA